MMPFTHAIARRPGKDLAAGITTSDLGAPDYTTAINQFDAYVRALTDCGIATMVLDPLEGHPDAHFVEDTAVVTPDVAVMKLWEAAEPSRFDRPTNVAESLPQ